MGHEKRSVHGCLCCRSANLTLRTTLISPFLAFRAWNGRPSVTQIATCNDCGLRFFDRGLSKEEGARYYLGYRDEKYFRDRHRFEPFYTRQRWLQEGEWLRSDARRADLAALLQQAGLGLRFDAILDHGGGTGHLIRGLDAPRKAVFDIAGEALEPGVQLIEDIESTKASWELVVSSHVLEHLTDPNEVMSELSGLLRPGGHAYIEVPDELWRDWSLDSVARSRLLSWVVHRPALQLLGDIYSTIPRVLTGILPPFGFTPTREHLNYFTAAALRKLAGRHGLTEVLAARNSKGHLCLICRKEPAAPANSAMAGRAS